MRTILFASLLAIASPGFAQPEPDESDPLIAAVIVYSTSYSIERWESYCAKENPSSATSIAAARESWMASHGDLLTAAGTLFKTRYSRDERMNIAVQARLSNDELESKLASATAASRKSWCDQSAARILSPQMDLNGRTTLVRALRDFRP